MAQVVDTSTSPPETHTFTYDSSYRTTSNTQGPRGTISYTYTPGDQVASYTVEGGGPTATYAYYLDGSLNTIAWTPVAGLFKYTYTLRGQYDQILFPNGQSRNYTYDDQGRLLQLANLHPAVGNLATFTYAYDRNHTTGQDTMLGQRTSMIDDRSPSGSGGDETNYHYDSNYRLIRADYPPGPPFNDAVHEWTYDFIGNRLTNTIDGVTETYSYFRNGSNPKNGQRLQSAGSRNFAYDANGNTATIAGPGEALTLSWNYHDRMTGLSGTATATHAYDYHGRRIRSATALGGEEFVYRGLDRIADLGAVPATYLFGSTIDEPLAIARGSDIYFLGIDVLGSIIVIIDSSSVANQRYYDSWGRDLSQAEPTASPFTYTSREATQGALLFYRARHYAPRTGRFISEDPLKAKPAPLHSARYHWYDAGIGRYTQPESLGYLSEFALYEYAADNPLLFRDPLGLLSAPPDNVIPFPGNRNPYPTKSPWECDDVRPFDPNRVPRVPVMNPRRILRAAGKVVAVATLAAVNVRVWVCAISRIYCMGQSGLGTCECMAVMDDRNYCAGIPSSPSLRCTPPPDQPPVNPCCGNKTQ